MRGELTAFILVATTIFDGFNVVGFGIRVVTLKAFTLGATAVPGPITEIEDEGWLWHHQTKIISLSTTEEGGLGLSVVRIPIDSKAMRKLGSDEVIVGVIETTAEVGTATMVSQMSTRMLIKLP